jgi:WD40 repeat protein
LVYSAAFSPDGARVVTASSDNSARVWDAANGAPVSVPLRHDDRINSAAFSSDGRRVVTASADDTARVWDAATGAPIGNSILHLGPVRSAALSPDGARVLTASDDNTGRISPTPRVDPDIFATACKSVGDHDTTNLSVRYGVDIADPICQPGALAPDPPRMIDR